MSNTQLDLNYEQVSEFYSQISAYIRFSPESASQELPSIIETIKAIGNRMFKIAIQERSKVSLELSHNEVQALKQMQQWLKEQYKNSPISITRSIALDDLERCSKLLEKAEQKAGTHDIR